MIIKIDGSKNRIFSILLSVNSGIKEYINISNNISTNYTTYELEPAPEPIINDNIAPEPIINDNIAPSIILNPSNITIEAFNGIYIDNSSGDIISDNSFSLAELIIDVCSNVISNVVGTYQFIYNVSDPCGNDASAVRTVNIIDTTPPIITLSGENPQTLYIGDTYHELEATALDIVDGLLSFSSFNVDLTDLCMNVAGSYNIIYNISDSCNNDASAIRVVNVVNITNNIETKIITNPELVDYQIPSYYQSQSGGSIIYTQPNSYYRAYCVPTSFANILHYYSDVSGKNLALQLNYTSQNSHPPLTDFLYNYQSRPLTANGVTDLNKIDLGYIFNTNAHGYDLSDGSYIGTKLHDFNKFIEFMKLISPNAQYRYYNKGFGYNSDISYAYSSISGETLTPISYNTQDINNVFNDIKSDISNGRPIILSFSHWNIIFNNSYANNGIINVSGQSIYLYDFSGQVSSTTDIQSTNPLYSNPEEIEEIWDPEAGLGHTVNCVGYIENLSNKNWVIIQDNVKDSEKYVGVVLDPSYLSMITTFDFSPQGSIQVTNLQCLLPDSSLNIINSSGNKYVFNNGSNYDDTLTYGLYNGIYTINNVPSSHPIAFLNNDVSNVFDYSGTKAIVDIVVSGGNNSDPYYTFTPNINDSNFNFIPGYTYRFTGNTISNSHPFYISDVGRNQQSTELIFSGNGTFNSGITGSQSFTMTIPYNYSKSLITYYCVADSSMVKTKSIVSTLVNGNYYNFYDGTVILNISGDFGTISAYCLYHGYMGTENKFNYTNVCNPNPFYSLSSNVSPLPSGYNGSIRIFDNLGGGVPSDFLVSEINNSSIENPTKEVALYIENNEIKIKLINASYDGRKLGSLIFNLYDEFNNLVDANVSPEKVNITIANYVISPGNNYFLIAPAPGTPGENYLSLGLAPQLIGILV